MVETTQWPLQKHRHRWILVEFSIRWWTTSNSHQESDPDANFVKGHDIQEQSTSQSMDNENSSQNEVVQQFCKFTQMI